MRQATAATMGRPKKQRGGEPPKGPTRLAILASPEWAKWVGRGAKFCRTDVSKLVDAALADYLRARGFQEPPPDRTP